MDRKLRIVVIFFLVQGIGARRLGSVAIVIVVFNTGGLPIDIAAVLDLLVLVRRVAERRSAEVERVVRSYFQNRDNLEPVSRNELIDRLKVGIVKVAQARKGNTIKIVQTRAIAKKPAATSKKTVASSPTKIVLAQRPR